MNLGGPELLIVVAIAVLLFGAGWLPKAARNLGKAKVEFDEVQRQFNETKDSVVEATGIKELESTVRKANKALNTSPQKLMKDAAKSAVAGGGAAAPTDAEPGSPDSRETLGEDEIEDAEIVDPPQGSAATHDTPATDDASDPEPNDDTNINIDFR